MSLTDKVDKVARAPQTCSLPSPMSLRLHMYAAAHVPQQRTRPGSQSREA